MLITGTQTIPGTNVTSGLNSYAYVKIDGDIGIQLASSPEEAIRLALDIKVNSGVMLIN